MAAIKKKKAPLTAVILAAGQGKRMHSSLPKVCHKIGGKSLILHVLETAKKLIPTQIIIVYGHGAEAVIQECSEHQVQWVEQKEQLGTGHAVAQIQPHVDLQSNILVLYGDVPFIRAATLKQLIKATPANSIGLILAHVNDPKGLGRIGRDETNQITSIVEERDATDDQKKINEVFSGILCMPARLFFEWWPNLRNDNAQKEYYLPDVVRMAVASAIPVHSIHVNDSIEILGINTKVQLAYLERIYQQRLAHQWMEAGVTIQDPNRLDIRGDVSIGKDTTLDINVVLEGKVVIGDHCSIGPHTVIKNSTLANHVEVRAHSVIDGVNIGESCIIGPFARLRPGTVLHSKTRVGNFVEIKQSTLGAHTKVNHLSYIGDAILGEHVNIGAGVITVNYDGANKHATIIESGSFIGCDSQLIAPVTIHENTFVGAGSTITKDTEPDTLALSRSEQKTIKNWRRPQKKNKE